MDKIYNVCASLLLIAMFAWIYTAIADESANSKEVKPLREHAKFRGYKEYGVRIDGNNFKLLVSDSGNCYLLHFRAVSDVDCNDFDIVKKK